MPDFRLFHSPTEVRVSLVWKLAEAKNRQFHLKTESNLKKKRSILVVRAGRQTDNPFLRLTTGYPVSDFFVDAYSKLEHRSLNIRKETKK